MTEIRSGLLERFPWLRHGFGTRAGPLTQAGMVSLKQIHSSIVLIPGRREGCIGEGDALITDSPGVTLSVRTADCLPIILADEVNRVIAVIHAGWRGTAARIAAKTLAEMHLGRTRPVDVSAAIGPGIGPCCYEVGEEVARQFGFNTKCHLDLAAENIRQLESSGVPRANIDHLAECTFCNPGRFYSWRRDQDPTARMISYAALM